MLEFKNVSFKYDNMVGNIINSLSFSINQGEFVSIIGASGCGKSTIFRLINRLENNFSGDILINNTPLSSSNHPSAFMPQKDLLVPWRTINKNIQMPLEILGISKKERNKKSSLLLKEFGLEEYKDKYPKDLSGGMRQRVSFIRASITGANLLLLDEPFSALDYLTKVSMQEWILKSWLHNKKTILFITHDVEEAIFLSTKILVIRNTPITSFEEINVPIPYPRTRDCLKEANIISLKEELIKKLRMEVE